MIGEKSGYEYFPFKQQETSWHAVRDNYCMAASVTWLKSQRKARGGKRHEFRFFREPVDIGNPEK